jgi:hypothetical protein
MLLHPWLLCRGMGGLEEPVPYLEEDIKSCETDFLCSSIFEAIYLICLLCFLG